ncbi:MAG: hydroxyacylglutathione hydrolase [Steroidobacteraceae bacterium]|jgi:hydroxyacylglutathione hydrolase
MSNNASPIRVRPLRAFSDNYIWLIEAPQAPGRVVVVDPGDAEPVFAELRRSGASLAAILLTHHHADHIGGVEALLGAATVPVLGPDDARIPAFARRLQDGESLQLPDLGLQFQILHIPGHTLSHIAFWGHGTVFCGDTLFSAGCGRMFEGTPVQMSTSLQRLSALPPETRVFAGHEYTAANLRFALAADPGNTAAARYRELVDALRAKDTPTLPSTIDLENRVNPFLRCDDAAIRAAAVKHAGKPLHDTAAVFAELRSWKDGFRA